MKCDETKESQLMKHNAVNERIAVRRNATNQGKNVPSAELKKRTYLNTTTTQRPTKKRQRKEKPDGYI